MQITYTKMVSREVREDFIEVLMHYQLVREEEFLAGNIPERYSPPSERKPFYLVKLHGLRERGEDLEELIERIKAREQCRQTSDQTILSLQSGLKVKLDETCIRQFCLDNRLNPTQTITRSDLRRIVLQRPTMNATQYGAGLRLLRIPIEVPRSND